MEPSMEIPTAGPETYCRLCLGKDGLLGVFTLERVSTEPSGGSAELVEKIYECTNIKLSAQTDATCAICGRCLQAVRDFYHFRVRSNKVNDLIQETTVLASGDGTEDVKRDSDTATNASSASDEEKRPASRPLVPVDPAVGERKHHRCRYCPKSFRTEAALTEHRNRVHVAGRQHHCPNCLAQFQHAPSLARHVRSRSCFAFTRYRCRVCSESFTDRDQWAVHIRIHAKDFPYQCPDCWSQFKHKATLRRHANTVHLLVRA
ncbi:zinc finger protein 2-like [Anopheles nili]|uniref:zinc finger protein 2-like n=1 Tax=Anopheles nili TaxID=185578 RepID=UPI00237B2FFF|nr:zinc finger protein 2-like [Anopheles nili]